MKASRDTRVGRVACLAIAVLFGGTLLGADDESAKRDPLAWDRLKAGMTKEQVTALLGEPGHREVKGAQLENWAYAGGGIAIFKNGSLADYSCYPTFLYQAHLKRGEIRVKQEWRAIADMAPTQLCAIRDDLEIAYEKAAGTERERDVRQQLRAIRHKLGPNKDPDKAFQWRVLCLIPTRIRVEWEDDEGKPHQYSADIKDPKKWAEWIDREMEQFAQYMFEKSWGKIRVAYMIRTTEEPILHFKKDSEGKHGLNDRGVARLVKGMYGRGDAVSLFVWVKKDGQGDFPSTGAHAHAVKGSSFTIGAHMTAFYTSEERVSTPGGWAKERGGGMIHEFWHHARWVLSGNPISWEGWRPSVNNEDDWKAIQEEVRAQGVEPSDNRYDEFFPSWFTWRMIAKLRKHYGVAKGWKCPPVSISKDKAGK